MITALALGFAATLACLAFQAVAMAFATRYFARAGRQTLALKPRRTVFLRLSALMSILMLGNLVQIALWAALYRTLGAFPDIGTALYFSGATFTTLGYGDVVLAGPIRLLGPLQAANGLMMFGITTAAFIAAVQRGVARSPDSANG